MLMDAFNLITMTLPGVAVTYQGEEIGMVNNDISYEDTVDPSGCNCGPGIIEFYLITHVLSIGLAKK